MAVGLGGGGGGVPLISSKAGLEVVCDFLVFVLLYPTLWLLRLGSCCFVGESRDLFPDQLVSSRGVL